MKIILQDIYDLITKTIDKFVKDDMMTHGAAIAFYTIFSIAPIFILLVSTAGYFLHEDVIVDQMQQFAGDFLDDDTIETLNQFVSGRLGNGAGIITTIIAVFTIIFGATTVVSQLKMALNKIWNVIDVDMNSVWNFLFTRVLSFGMILLFSFLLLASLIIEAVVGIMGTFFTDLLPNIQFDLIKFITEIVTMGFAILSFTLIFKILPDVHARWRDVFVGAIVTTVLFLAGKYLIEYYFSASGIDAAYRAAGSLIIFVIWVYYNVIIVLFGAVFTQVYTAKFGGKIMPYKFVRLEGLPSIERREVKKEIKEEEGN